MATLSGKALHNKKIKELLELHSPIMGMHFTQKYHKDQDFKQTGAYWIVVAILNGTHNARERLLFILNTIITVSALTLSTSLPLFANPDFVLHWIESPGYTASSPIHYEDTIFRVFHILIALAVGTQTFALLMAFGYVFIVQQAVRDIDFVNVIDKMGFQEWNLCFVPLALGILAQTAAVITTGFFVYKDSIAAASFVGGMVLFTFVWVYIKGFCVWDGILYPQFGGRYIGWDENVRLAKQTLAELTRLYGTAVPQDSFYTSSSCIALLKGEELEDMTGSDLEDANAKQTVLPGVELERLVALRKAGDITQEEYEVLKKRLLSSK